MLEKEFLLDMGSLEVALKYMLETKIITVIKGIHSINKDNLHLAQIFAGLIENYLESYLCVAQYINKVKKLGKKDVLKAINRYASRMYKKDEIKRYEALCLPVYKGALDTFKSKGLIDDSNNITSEKAIVELIKEIHAYLED